MTSVLLSMKAEIKLIHSLKREFTTKRTTSRTDWRRISDWILKIIRLWQHQIKLSQAQMEGAGLASVIQLAEGSGALTLENIVKYRVTEECLSIFNVDGSIRHTTKSKLLEHLILQPVLIKPSRYCSIVDMRLIWRLATPTPDDRETKRCDGIYSI